MNKSKRKVLSVVGEDKYMYVCRYGGVCVVNTFFDLAYAFPSFAAIFSRSLHNNVFQK
jgi:hypothetical protein